MTTDPMMLLATARAEELQADARRHALVRLVTCCRPSALRMTAQAVRERLRALVRRDATAPCCA